MAVSIAVSIAVLAASVTMSFFMVSPSLNFILGGFRINSQSFIRS